METSKDHKRPRVYLTGATGFVGKNILEDLSAQYRFRCLVRKGSESSRLKQAGIGVVYGDIRDQKTIKPEKDEIVIHAAGMLGGSGDSWETNAEGTKNVVLSLSGQRLIHISSAGVHGPGIDMTERSPINPSNRYEESKAAAEEIVKGYPNHAILRPEFLYGPHDSHAYQLFEAVRDRNFFLIGDGKSLLHPTYIKDLISAIQGRMDDDKVGTWLVVGEKAVTVKELQHAIASCFQVAPRKVKVPIVLAHLMRGPLNRIYQAFGKASPLTKERIRFFTESRSFASGKRKTPLIEGIQETIRWNQTCRHCTG